MKNLLTLIFSLVFLSLLTSGLYAQKTFINEVNYKSNYNQGVEIAGEAGTDLDGYRIDVYNKEGWIIETRHINNEYIPGEEGGNYGAIWMEVSQLHQGNAVSLAPPGGNSGEVQFLSYGTTSSTQNGFNNNFNSNVIVTGAEGPAAGLTSEFIGIQLLPLTSLELGGIGTEYADFSWELPLGITPGLINTNQVFQLLGGLSGGVLIEQDQPELNTPSTDGEYSLPDTEISSGITEVSVYPNPAAHFINIDLSSVPVDTEVQVDLFDLNGVQLKRQNGFGGDPALRINVENLIRGNYLIRIQIGDEIEARRFIKK